MTFSMLHAIVTSRRVPKQIVYYMIGFRPRSSKVMFLCACKTKSSVEFNRWKLQTLNHRLNLCCAQNGFFLLKQARLLPRNYMKVGRVLHLMTEQKLVMTSPINGNFDLGQLKTLHSSFFDIKELNYQK